MRLAFILNPAAGNGRARRLAPRLLAAAPGATVHPTTGPRHAEALARELARSADRVCAVGGDGTVHEVAAGLAGGAVPLGIVPFGTGNDLATTLGIPSTLEDAVALCASGAARPIDVLRLAWTDADGQAGERLAVNAVGAGFDAASAAAAPRYKRLGGVAAYVVAVLQTLGDWRRPDRGVRVDVDGALAYEGPLFLLSVGNGPCVGGGFRLTPGAAVDDGRLDVCVVAHARTPRVLRLLPTALRGGHVGQPEVTMGAGQTVTLRTSGRPVPVHADGEVVSLGVGTLQTSVWAGALHVVQPGVAAASDR